MLRTLEIAWLCITMLSLLIAIYQFFKEGWESALWMLFVTLISVFMYSIRRKQRIRYEQKDEKELYH
jgi:c-di-AMP phosphodiesterase-like protein